MMGFLVVFGMLLLIAFIEWAFDDARTQIMSTTEIDEYLKDRLSDPDEDI